MDTLRTPDERFADLPDYPFEPHYAEIDDGDGGRLRVHYLDEGPPGAAPVVLLHGEPSWSFLYRRMLPVLTAAGHRCIAPDLPGFGKSDKPAARADYTYQRFMDWTEALLFGHLDLSEITLFGQDWGGLIGLRLAAEHPERFARLVAANTALATGDTPPNDAFFAWQEYTQETPNFRASPVIQRATERELSDAEVAAYDAPFPDERFQAGAREFPVLVPTTPADPAAGACRRAWQRLQNWQKPFLTVFSDGDPIFAGIDEMLQQAIPGAAGQPHRRVSGGHFLQEDSGEEIAEAVAAFIADTPNAV